MRGGGGGGWESESWANPSHPAGPPLSQDHPATLSSAPPSLPPEGVCAALFLHCSLSTWVVYIRVYGSDFAYIRDQVYYARLRCVFVSFL